MTLEQRSVTEGLYWAICSMVLKIVDELEYVPDELKNLESLISDTYFCNYSIFSPCRTAGQFANSFQLFPFTV